MSTDRAQGDKGDKGGQADPGDRGGETDTTRDAGDGKKPVEAGTDGASSEASGYRRDDYWRKEQEGLPADVGARPAHGQDYQSPEERGTGDDAGAYRPDGEGSDAGDDDSARTGEKPRESGKPPHAR